MVEIINDPSMRTQSTVAPAKEIEVLPPYMCLYEEDATNYVFASGRAAGKSFAVADFLLILGAQLPQRWLCGRETLKSSGETSFELMRQRIDYLGLGRYFRTKGGKIIGNRANNEGTEFTFLGLRNDAQQVRGLVNMHGFWLDEAQYITKSSWNTVEGTFVRFPGYKGIMTLNPINPDDVIYETFFINEPPANSIIRRTSYMDNVYLPPDAFKKIEDLKRRDPDRYRHVYGGDLARGSALNIFRNYRTVDNRFDKRIPPNAVRYGGIDFGWTAPSAAVAGYKWEDTLYIRWENYRSRVKNKTWGKFLSKIPEAKRIRWRADYSHGGVIAELQDEGFKVHKATKGANSVLTGIEYLQGLDIYIHKDCTNTLNEFSNYRWEIDKATEEARIDKVDERCSDHSLDAVRYWCEFYHKRQNRTRNIKKARIC